MNLVPDKLVFGVAPALLVDCARQLHAREGCPFSMDDFCRALGVPANECLPVLEKMVVSGFATPDVDGGAACYRPTPKLAQLALAKMTSGLPRREAERLLDKIIAKAHTINCQADSKFRPIRCLVVFGSFLGDKPMLGDLDIGVELHHEHDTSRMRRDQSLAEWFREGTAPDRRTYAALRLRRPRYVSTHTLEEVLCLGTPYRVIFGELPPSKRGDLNL